jgi:hypothetical protein
MLNELCRIIDGMPNAQTLQRGIAVYCEELLNRPLTVHAKADVIGIFDNISNDYKEGYHASSHSISTKGSAKVGTAAALVYMGKKIRNVSIDFSGGALQSKREMSPVNDKSLIAVYAEHGVKIWEASCEERDSLTWENHAFLLLRQEEACQKRRMARIASGGESSNGGSGGCLWQCSCCDRQRPMKAAGTESRRHTESRTTKNSLGRTWQRMDSNSPLSPHRAERNRLPSTISIKQVE